MEHPVGSFKLAGYQADLQDILKKKVDLITERSISDSFRNIIKEDLTVVYERNG
jgi:predicted nucleotidyltransferase